MTNSPQPACASATPHIIVAVPARDEAERIRACLGAFAIQTRRPDAVLLMLNNCTDATSAIAGDMAPRLPFRLCIHSLELPPPLANAGHARRLAMQLAADRAGPNGILLTTDADAVVPPCWIERNVAALADADLVCGRVVLDPIEAAAIHPHLHADDALECELAALLDRLTAKLDPDPADPLPRHTEAAGASLAVTVAAFARAGGIPKLPSGEDRAFVQALARIDARIRHDPAISVVVSGRLIGRAPGGMADTIRRRMQQQDEFTDASIEPASDAYRRVDFRRRARLAWRGADADELAIDLGIAGDRLRRMLDHRYFGTAWADIEAASPFLIRRRVRFTELPWQIAYAQLLLEQPAEHLVDSPP